MLSDRIRQIIIIAVLVLSVNSQFKFNLGAVSKSSSLLSATVCQKNTQIDFKFSGTLTDCSSSDPSCTISQTGSTLQFLDAFGYNGSYSLANFEISTLSYLPDGTTFSYYLKFSDGLNEVIVEVPFTTNTSQTDRIFNIDKVTYLNDFKSFLTDPVTNKKLSGLSFLNLRDHGHFFTVTIQDSGKTITLLTSAFTYTSSSSPVNPTISSTRLQTEKGNLAFDQSKTGNRLCYGSLFSGIFQTHLRESYPLWGMWISLVLFWLYILLSQPNEVNCYDKKFQENKWTCWGFYSLHFLGHEDIFTKLSRCVSLYTTFSWQACVIACLYGTIGYKFDTSKIVWFAAVSFAASLPIPYVLGCGFLKNIYQTNINKFQIHRKKVELLNKSSAEKLEDQVDKCQQKLYAYYYWYYFLCFSIGLTSWVVAIHVMSLPARQFYDFHKYWLASLGIVFVFDNLIFDPLMTKIFGNYSFYRARGHYYDFRLGELHKMVAE